jgi:histidine ammonia-lyase
MDGDKKMLDGKSLRIEDILAVAEKECLTGYPEEVWKRISEFRKELEKQLVEHPEIKIYGVNTGCGDLKDEDITPASLEEYQRRYIRAHNCGTGNSVPVEVVRAAMAIRLNSFAKGYSAVRPETCRLMIDMLNEDVTPWVLEEGSVGASGDLVPLAMIGAVLLGISEAKAYYKGNLLSAPDALREAGLEPTNIGAKEAMALTNGSNLMAAVLVFAVRDAEILLKSASISMALSLEAIRGETNAFSDFIANTRPHKGQKETTRQIRNLLESSRRATPEAQKAEFPHQDPSTAKERVQDRYSFRCAPQVHGAVYEAIEKLKEVLLIEINSATDNPLVFKEGDIFKSQSGGNFHGQPLAVVTDYVKCAMTGLALISNKRAFSMLDKAESYGLPKDLAADPKRGDTGLMIAQYAGAARAAECRVLSTPASVMSISTSANQEDFVSMGSIGAVHLAKVIYNAQIVVAIELLCALRGIQMTQDYLPPPLRHMGRGTARVYDFLNGVLPPVSEDQYLRSDIEEITKIVRTGKLVGLVADLL